MRTFVERYLPLFDGSNDGGAGSPDASSTPSAGAAPGAATVAPPVSPVAPSAAPALPSGTPSVPNEPASPGTADAFSGMDGDDLDTIEIPEGDTGPLPADGAEPPVAPVVVPPVAPAAPAPVVGQTPVQPPVAAPSVSGQTLPPASEIQEIVQGLETHSKALAQHIAGTTFALTKEEADALEVNAAGAIPGLMARVHLEASKNTLKQIETFVPKMIERAVERILQTKSKSTEALADFYKAWPALSADKHQALVDQYAKVFRQTNPQASRADAIKFVGSAIHAQLGLVPTPAARPNGQTPPPFAPARPGARQVSALPVDAPFAGLGQDIDEG